MFVIPNDLDVQTCGPCHAALSELLEAPDGPVALDLADLEASQVALQILFAALRETRDRGIEVTLGDNASRIATQMHSGKR